MGLAGLEALAEFFAASFPHATRPRWRQDRPKDFAAARRLFWAATGDNGRDLAGWGEWSARMQEG
jgi:hypothetical protein